MKTVVIQFGNSDNKLTQNIWAHFVESMKQTIEAIVYRVHFAGGSHPFDPWQNACWIAEVDPERLSQLKEEVTKVRKSYEQDSVAILVGDTEFI